MSIENDIKQGKFKNEYHRLSVNLIYTGNFILYQHNELLRKYGISPQQFNVLRILRGSYPKAMRVNDISDRMLDRMSNTSRLIDRLLAKQLLERIPCPSDRRAVNVTISAQGLNLLSSIEPEMIKYMENFSSAFSEEEAGRLNAFLDKVREHHPGK